MVAPSVENKTGAENVLWDLSIFYKGLDDPQLESDFKRLNDMADAFAAKYKGRVASLTPAEMHTAITEMEAISDLRGRLGSFAALNYYTDATNAQLGALFQRVSELGAQIGQKVVFFDLEWSQADDATADALINAPELAKYKFQLESERRFKPYRLSEVEEQLLMEKSVTGRNAWRRLFGQVLSALRFDDEGQQVNMTTMLRKLYDLNPEVRRRAADSLTAGMKSRAMELTYIFNVVTADKASEDTRRGYPSWISERNLDNLAPDTVVEALVSAVTSSYELVARHYRLKRALLGLPELFDYDRYAPIPAKESSEIHTWEEARDICLKAFDAFSAEVGQSARLFFDNDWIHAPVTPSKRGGAFASPTVPSAHPFVFVNFTGSARDVSTLAHELGHGIHMHLSAKANGWQGLYTPLTTAEMASTFNEMLVFEDLMKAEPDPKVRLSMLANKIEDSFATIYRQTAMNRFEDALHTARRNEGELTTERISELWLSTQRAMFGDSVTLREDYGIWWSYISHFIDVPGYVYAYAFGELLVLALYNLYKERGADFVPQYLEVLKAGGSDYPDRILAKVGVDLNDPAFWSHGINALGALVDEEERLARELYPEKFA